MYELQSQFEASPNVAQVNLEYLNITDITMMIPVLAKFPYLQTLSFHANKLTFIPDLSALKQLRQFDLSRNPLKFDKNLLNSLFTAPKLQSLIIDVNQTQRAQLQLNLPKLKILNNIEINRRIDNQTPKIQQIKRVKQKLNDEQKKAKDLLNKIYSLLQGKKNHLPDPTEQFAMNMKQITQEFEYFYENINTVEARQCVLLYYKSKLYQTVDTQLLTFLEDSGLPSIAHAFEEVNKFKKQIFQEVLKIILSKAYEEDFQSKTMKEGNKIRKQELYQNQIVRLKRQVFALKRQNQQLTRTNDKFINKICKNGIKQVRNANMLKNQKIDVFDSFPPSQSRRNENQIFVNKFTVSKTMSKSPSKSSIKKIPSKLNLTRSNSLAHKSFSNAIPKPPVVLAQIQNIPMYRVKSKSKQKTPNRFERISSLVDLSNKKMNNNKSKKELHKRSVDNFQDYDKKKIISQRKENASNQPKKITCDQMKALIQDFINQKMKFNLQCFEKGELFQTPQEFLFTYFLRKYGLKQIALEWSLLTIKAIEKFSKGNSLIQSFGKILKNQLDEEFYIKAKKFKNLLNASLSLQKSQKILQEDLQIIFFKFFPEQRSQQFPEWLQTIQFYPLQDSDEKQYYCFRKNLIYALQLYHIKYHQRQISSLLQVFKAFDKDQDGILQNQEIQRCINRFIQQNGQPYQDLNELSKKIISHRRKKGSLVSMTFSEFVNIMRQYF